MSVGEDAPRLATALGDEPHPGAERQGDPVLGGGDPPAADPEHADLLRRHLRSEEVDPIL